MTLRPLACCLFALALLLDNGSGGASAAAPAADDQISFPVAERLSYRVEWRFVTAGNVQVQLSPVTASTWETRLVISSAGIVNSLFYVHDEYSARMDGTFCAATSSLSAVEGKRRRLTTLNFDSLARKVHYEERDFVKNSVTKHVVDVPACTHELTGAFAWIRTQPLEPGKSIQVPMTDGKKFASVRVEVRGRETITVNGTQYHTLRCEAFLFDNVLYKRKGSLQIWLTDDADRVPVQLRLGLGFPVYNILLTLQKRERL